MSEKDPTSAEEPSNDTEANKALLEDASVLLMFHNAAVTNNETKLKPPVITTQQQQQQQQLQPQFQSTSPSLISPVLAKDKDFPSEKSSNTNTRISTPKINNLASPGPAIAALAEANSENGSEPGKSQKAIVAAAALAAAAGFPLIKKNNDDDSNEKQSIDEHLRSKEKKLKETSENEEIRDNDITDKEDSTPIEDVKEEEAESRKNSTTADTEMKDADDETAAEETQDEKPDPQPTKKEPVKRGRKPKRKPSTGKNYTVDPDSGIISCICSFDHDDGFTIQCDVCNRWQHGVCMGISDPDNAPDNYSCSICQPRPVDVKRAQKLQSQVLEHMKKGRGVSNKDKDDKSKDSNNSQSNGSKPKPKPSPPTNPYGKNLEETDIEVPESKKSHLVQYFPLKSNDYQDQEVFNFVEKLIQSNKSDIDNFTKHEFEDLSLPKLNVKAYSDVNNKKFNGISKLGLFTESNISEDELVCEFLGEINFKDNYISDSRNHYRIWGVEKPYVRFIPETPLVIDSRFSGNDSRFIRRSCHPNSKIKLINVDGTLKVMLITIKPVKQNSEITLNWNWDKLHPIKNIIEGDTFDQVSDADKPSLILSVESILTFVECACTSNSDCCLAKVKRASSHIYRSSRKNQTTSGIKLYQSKPSHISIQQRLLDKEISNINDSSNTKQHVSILSSTQTDQEDIGIRPFIYNYLTINNPNNNSNNVTIITNKRKLDEVDSKLDYLPIPLPLTAELNIKVDNTSNSTTTNKPVGAVKKLSFADYKKKKKPTA